MLRMLMMLAAAGVLLAGGSTAVAARPNGDDRIVFHSNRADGNVDIYSMRPDGSDIRRLTFDAAIDRRPRWSPDGARIAFVSSRAGDDEIFVMDADGSDVVQVTHDDVRDWDPSWTPDGRILYEQYADNGFGCPCEIRVTGVDGLTDAKVPTGPGNAFQPSAAPQGDRIAFASDRSGLWAIYFTTRRQEPDAGDGSDRAGLRGLPTALVAEGQRHPLRARPGRCPERPVCRPRGRDRSATAARDPEQVGGAGVVVAGRLDRPVRRVPRRRPPAEHRVAAPVHDRRRRDGRAAASAPARADHRTRSTTVDPIRVSGTRSRTREATSRRSAGDWSRRSRRVRRWARPWNQVDVHRGSQCSLPGNFDAEVGYEAPRLAGRGLLRRTERVGVHRRDGDRGRGARGRRSTRRGATSCSDRTPPPTRRPVAYRPYRCGRHHVRAATRDHGVAGDSLRVLQCQGRRDRARSLEAGVLAAEPGIRRGGVRRVRRLRRPFR